MRGAVKHVTHWIHKRDIGRLRIERTYHSLSNLGTRKDRTLEVRLKLNLNLSVQFTRLTYESIFNREKISRRLLAGF